MYEELTEFSRFWINISSDIFINLFSRNKLNRNPYPVKQNRKHGSGVKKDLDYKEKEKRPENVNRENGWKIIDNARKPHLFVEQKEKQKTKKKNHVKKLPYATQKPQQKK